MNCNTIGNLEKSEFSFKIKARMVGDKSPQFFPGYWLCLELKVRDAK